MTATIRTPGEDRTVVVGDVYRIPATGENTNGKYTLWETLVPPGRGFPPHASAAGRRTGSSSQSITFAVIGEWVVAAAGTLVNKLAALLQERKTTDEHAISVARAELEQILL